MVGSWLSETKKRMYLVCMQLELEKARNCPLVGSTYDFLDKRWNGKGGDHKVSTGGGDGDKKKENKLRVKTP